MDSQKKILLVDSDNELGDTFKAALTDGMFKILYADTCVSGIQKVFQYHPDLIFYNSNLDPLNGHEVFNALRFTTTFSDIPVCFFKDKEDEAIINFIRNNSNGSAKKLQRQRSKFQLNEKEDLGISKMPNGVVYDFDALFHLSPVGQFIFDKNSILGINAILLSILNFNGHDMSAITIHDIFENSSVKLIMEWMGNYKKGKENSFYNQVYLKDRAGENITMNLTIHELKREGIVIHFLGFLQTLQGNNGIVNYQLAHEVCNLLKRENVVVSESLEKKITQTIKQRIITDSPQKKSFFTRREYEVLRLSMEGLSIKIIADKLSLSTRTVEKYRTKLMVKSGARNIAEVIVFSIKNNLVTIQESVSDGK